MTQIGPSYKNIATKTLKDLHILTKGSAAILLAFILLMHVVRQLSIWVHSSCGPIVKNDRLFIDKVRKFLFVYYFPVNLKLEIIGIVLHCTIARFIFYKKISFSTRQLSEDIHTILVLQHSNTRLS